MIRADVTDFEMDAVTLNGVRLNLNIDIDDSELMDKVDELVSAIKDIDNGASQVNSGAETLSEATGTLDEKVSELYTGVGKLTSGTESLYSGLTSITSKNAQLTAAAYTAYEGLCSAASTALNSQLKENGMGSVALTPSNYSEQLMNLLQTMNADSVYQQAYQTALTQVTQQVDAQADELYKGYIETQADSIYQKYVASQADSLYGQVATQAVYEQLLSAGYTTDQASAFLESPEGQAAVSQAVGNMTEEQKATILASAVSGLTDEQKAQILQGALQSLTDEQKTQMRTAYIDQMMASDQVTAQLNTVMAKVSDAAKQISQLKGQLDSYGTFYQGLLDYTGAVSSAADGAGTLEVNMNTLYENTGTLHVSVGDLNDGVQKLYDGTRELADGTAEFVDKTSDMDTQISDEIEAMTSSLSGNDGETVSFVSGQNTNVKSVQFVIKTAAVEKADEIVDTEPEEVKLSFGQKLLRLFGMD